MDDDNSILPPPKRTPWNKGKLIGAKPPLLARHVWSIRTKLQIERRARELAMFNLAVDSKLRGCDVVAMRVEDVWKVPSDISESRSMMRLPSPSKSKSEVFGQSGHCSARLLPALRATTGREQMQQSGALPDSLDHLVGKGEELVRHGEAERLCGGQVDDKIELGWLLDRNVARLGAA